jgi:hypothetical protein
VNTSCPFFLCMQITQPIESLKTVASQHILNMDEATTLIEHYILEVKGVKIKIGDNSNVKLFEQAITIACNYYCHKEDYTHLSADRCPY